ncbi:unnamed protein product [Toxocara canis]|uniref:Uncharacterized protein n=1 Tax=Toxocara canis TaxID=6265 RepID=A0A3P7FK70_TOXCA|nr:unnamed protein product [Toxocara canis]
MTNSGSTDNVAKSPFKQTLAEWGNANRHREELLSPEIRRKSDFPNSTRLRNSMANLNAEESDDGRASPVSPLIQRFNSKTSQYRSFNLKKTSERNQKVLDQLAQLREKLKQKQQQMERSFAASNGSLIRRSRNNGTVNPVSDKSHETFAIV